MALNPSIPMSVQVPDVGGAINNAMLNAQRIQGMRQSEQEQPFRNQMLEAQAQGAQQTVDSNREQQRIQSLVFGAAELAPKIEQAKATGNLDMVKTALFDRKDQLRAQGITDTTETDQAIMMLDQPDGLQQLESASSNLINFGFQTGILKRQGGDGTASSRDFAQFQQLQERARQTGDQRDINAVKQFGVQAGFLPGERAETEIDKATRIAQARADVEAQTAPSIAADIEGAKITGAAEAKAKSAPLIAKTESFINREVKLAEKAAAERGDVITDLSRAEAALPGLTQVVDKLRELAPIATSTFGGRVFDTAVKELGFGATKGATASAKFGAMVNNQVLPLLKPTFGAAFTVQEGDALRATMGDVNASVEEKMATLDAFMEQKQRDIDTKQLQIDQTSAKDFDLEFDPATGTFK